jgi:hypothetical protein
MVDMSIATVKLSGFVDQRYIFQQYMHTFVSLQYIVMTVHCGTDTE